MISVVIQSSGGAERLARTLSSLVAGAVEGVVREVVVVDATADLDVESVADSAGCRLVAGRAQEGLAAVRCNWVLVLSSGLRLEDGWFQEVRQFLAAAPHDTRPAAARLRLSQEEGRGRSLIDLLRGPRPTALLAPREALLRGHAPRGKRLRSRAFRDRLTAD
jgi:hypothetical protein